MKKNEWKSIVVSAIVIFLAWGETKVQADGFWAKLSVPFDGQEEQSCLVTYGNNGSAKFPAPILQIVSDKDVLVAYTDGGEFREIIQFIAAGTSGEAGVLYPGEEGQVSFLFRPGSGGSVSVRSSEGTEWYEKPWSGSADMLSDISAPATRIALRGQNAKDYTLVRDLALAVKSGDASSSIYGRVVDGHGAGVRGVHIKISQDDDTDENHYHPIG